jgi:hypothetical protein
MKLRIVNFSMILVTAILFVLLTNAVAAARCQIGSISYAYPHQAATTQQIQVSTIVVGSCISNGADYYEVRVDLVDKLSGSILSSTSTPIGYKANNFTVTAKNSAMTPSKNVTWPLRVYVYVVRAGGTSGSYLFDYTTIGNATIQVGAIAVPEFHISSEFFIIIAFSAATLTLSQHRLREKRVD